MLTIQITGVVNGNQEGQSVEMIEHGGLQFSEEIKDNSYYIVYSWGSGNSLLRELDIRGR